MSDSRQRQRSRQPLVKSLKVLGIVVLIAIGVDTVAWVPVVAGYLTCQADGPSRRTLLVAVLSDLTTTAILAVTIVSLLACGRRMLWSVERSYTAVSSCATPFALQSPAGRRVARRAGRLPDPEAVYQRGRFRTALITGGVMQYCRLPRVLCTSCRGWIPPVGNVEVHGEVLRTPAAAPALASPRRDAHLRNHSDFYESCFRWHRRGPLVSLEALAKRDFHVDSVLVPSGKADAIVRAIPALFPATWFEIPLPCTGATAPSRRSEYGTVLIVCGRGRAL